MKTIKRIVLFAICMTIFCGCRSKSVQYQMMQDKDQIMSIQIVEGISEKDVAEGNFDKIKVIATIPQEEWEQFLRDFSNVQCFMFRNDPCQLLVGINICITYSNGAIELIGNWAAYYHWVDEKRRGYFKPYYFDVEQFESLIAQHIQ